MCISDTVKNLLSEPATYSAIAAAFSAMAAIASYQVNRKSLSSKLTDRLYDFDKLIMGNAADFEAFLKLTTRPVADYFATTPLSVNVVKLKSFAYYYLNLFDEIFAAYGSRSPRLDDTWKAWQYYIFERIRHPLVKELLLQECHLTIVNGQLTKVGDGPSVFTDAFIRFLMDNYKHWEGPCDQHFW